MKIKRLRLKNFCGVDEVEVHFAIKGVTLIHGPNEAGKSTLMTALDALFDHRDDSRREEVREIKNVSRDVGAEVEADIEIGIHNFTYFKRFHKDRETVLTVHSPKAENMTGREAHDRVEQILKGSVDTGLWRALRILQGKNLQMPALQDLRALSDALDRAAGQVQAGDTENALLDSAKNEYAKYYTETGREREVPLGQAQAVVTDAIKKEIHLEAELNSLREDVDVHAELDRSLITLKHSLTGLQSSMDKAQMTWDRVSQLADKLDRARSKKQIAAQALHTAQSDLQRRTDLIGEVEAADIRIKETQIEFEKTTSELNNATSEMDVARKERDDAISVAAQLGEEESVRRADLEIREDEFELIRMKERIEHVAAADEAAAQASVVVSNAKITEKIRAQIRDAEIQLKTAQGVLNSASPQLSIKALESISLLIGDDFFSLEPGQDRTLSVKAPIYATIGSQVEIRVVPGTSADALKNSVMDANNTLVKLCALGGVASPEDAETTWSSLVEAKRTLADRDRIAQEHLRDLTREELVNRIRRYETKVEAYFRNRTTIFVLPATSDECRTALEKVIQKVDEAHNFSKKIVAIFDENQEYQTKCREQHARSSATLDMAKKDHKNAIDRLAQARILSSDSQLKIGLEVAIENAQSASENFKNAENQLEGSDRESAKSFLDGAKTAFITAKEKCQALERDLISVRTRLDLMGNRGLAESLSEAKRASFEAKDSLSRLQRRALAAKLLYETLNDERQAMRNAYVTPLRDGIERLGHHVYGSTFRVEIDERLQVVSRTVDGVTVAVKQLSNGAQEQLSLLTRLAVASMVSEDGGVPLVIDDALGSTDEGRLESMGAVLRVASQNTQTIIITCAPERYVHVGAQAAFLMRRSNYSIEGY